MIGRMSLPDGFLEELRDRVSLSDVVGRKVTWDMRKTNQSKGDWWAPCPFHNEKTASFHVDDGKGYYYCFGCQAKGDAISFMRETEGLGFLEAVERLAGVVGMDMPSRDPQAAAKADRRSRLSEVMEAAVRFYRRALASGAGEAARGYLDRRGLDGPTLERFELGFAPNARTALIDHLAAKGVDMATLEACGLAAEGDRGGAYDRFRDRIIFPIRDGRERPIGFGGRAMSAEARAKYLNSPESELFHKGRTLYNLAPARAAVRDGAALVVAEGYMDVIALHRAGFEAAVAPLGTAITEEQLALLWKLAPEPVVALDGDAAGLRAAMRLIDLALPQMAAGQGVRFALMPAGQDPDDLIRDGGPAAMAAALEAAVPMVDLLWRRETDGKVFDSPERRAGLEATLMAATGQIADPVLRQHYRRALKDKLWEAFRKPAKRDRGRPAARSADRPLDATRRSTLAAGQGPDPAELREATILALLLAHPHLLERHSEALEDLALTGAGHEAIRAALGAWQAAPKGRPEDTVAEECGAQALETLRAHPHLAVVAALRDPADTEGAARCLEEEIGKLRAIRGWELEMRDAEDDADPADERTVWRLTRAAEARERSVRADLDDRTEFDTLPNGAKVDRSERAAFDDLIRSLESRTTRRD